MKLVPLRLSSRSFYRIVKRILMITLFSVILYRIFVKEIFVNLHVPILKISTFFSEKKSCSRLKEILNKLDKTKIAWIYQRINSNCVSWEKYIKKEYKIEENFNDKIFFVIGMLIRENWLHLAESAFKGGPLGELVQWSDTITSIFHLGYDIEIIINYSDLVLKINSLTKSKFIFTDYYGLNAMTQINHVIMNAQSFKCKLRIIDSFGTESIYNLGLKNCLFCGKRLINKQYMTMYPHTPDNSFLGFLIQGSKQSEYLNKRNIAVIYGKDKTKVEIIQNYKYLNLIQKYFELHFTYSSDRKDGRIYHGILHGEEYFDLLKSAKVFVGVGFPYEGPAPLEAISHGCIYLNPMLLNNMKIKANEFFSNKPTSRKLIFQNSYCESYIPLGHSYNINMENFDELETILKKISTQKIFRSYIPYEFTHSGIFDRIDRYLKTQNFCKNQEKKTFDDKYDAIQGLIGEDCNRICLRNKRNCEWDYFEHLSLHQIQNECSSLSEEEKLNLPGYLSINGKNISCSQNNNLYYSCSSSHKNIIRICPCR